MCGGNRQDSAFEGALPVYNALDEMLKFTDECLMSSENLLQRSLFLSLGSMEIVALLRVASVVHVAIVLPMQWLAVNTHKLGHRIWGERSMGRAYDLLLSACLKIQDSPELFLNYEYVMNVFQPD